MLTYLIIATAASLLGMLTFRESSFFAACFVMGTFFSGLLYAV